VCWGGDVIVKWVGVFRLGTTNKLELFDKFYYFGDMLGKGGGAEEASRLRVKYAWGKFNQLAPILTMRDLLEDTEKSVV